MSGHRLCKFSVSAVGIFLLVGLAFVWEAAAAASSIPSKWLLHNGMKNTTIQLNEDDSSNKIVVAYAYDATIQELFVGLNVTHAQLNTASSINGGILSFGLRPTSQLDRELHAEDGMGPAEFVSFSIADGSQACTMNTHLKSTGNTAPSAGAGSSRGWNVRGLRLHRHTDSDSGTIFAEFQLYPFRLPSSSIAITEAMYAISSEAPPSSSCDPSQLKYHDVAAGRVNITLNTGFRRPEYLWGCAHGAATLSPSSPTSCSVCNENWAGGDCDLACNCGTTDAAHCGANVSSPRAFCDTCDHNFFGSLCSKECKCVKKHTKSCADGPSGDGRCVCKAGFDGQLCDTCIPTRFNENCTGVCLCDNGICSSGFMGTGACASCDQGFAGRYCNISCPSCRSGYFCDEGVLGTGECISNEPPVPTTPAPPTQTPVPPPPPVDSVVIALNMDITADYNETQFKDIIAASLSLEAWQIKVLRAAPGSVIVEMEIIGLDPSTTQKKYTELIAKVNGGDASLSRLKPLGVTTTNTNMTFAPGVIPTSPPDPSPPSNTIPYMTPTPPLGSGGDDGGNDIMFIIIGAVVGGLVVIGIAVLLGYFIHQSRVKAAMEALRAKDDGDEMKPRITSRDPSNPGSGINSHRASAVASPRPPPEARYAFGSEDQPLPALAASSKKYAEEEDADKPNTNSESLGDSEVFAKERDRFRRSLMGDDDSDADDSLNDRGHIVERPTYSGQASPKESNSRSTSFSKAAGDSPAVRSPQNRSPQASPRGLDGSAIVPISPEKPPDIGADAPASPMMTGYPASPPPPPPAISIPREDGVSPSQPPVDVPYTPPPLPPAPRDSAEALEQRMRVEEARKLRTPQYRPSTPEMSQLPGTPRQPQDEEVHGAKVVEDSDEEDETDTATDTFKKSHMRSSQSSQGTSPSVSNSRPGSAHLGTDRSPSRPGSAKRTAKRCKYCGELFQLAPSMCSVEQRPHAQLREERKAEKKAKKELKKKMIEDTVNMYEQAGDALDDESD